MAAEATHTRLCWQENTIPGGLVFSGIYILLALITLRPEWFSLGVDLSRTIWFPSGVALAFIVQAGLRAWPWIFGAEVVVTLLNGDPITGALGTATGGVAEAVLAAWLLGRIGFFPSLSRWRDVVALIGLGAGLSSLVGAGVSVSVLALSGGLGPSPLFPLWARWWLTHSGGILLFTPVVLTLCTGLGSRVRHSPVEAGIVGAGLALVGILLFGPSPLPGQSQVLLYLPFPLLLWTAFRFGLPGAAMANLVLIAPALLGTALGQGPLVGADPTVTLLQLWVFMAVCVLTSLVVAGTVEEREAVARARIRAEEERRELGERMHQAQKLESLGVLAGGIAHDFNNLLVTIMGNADLAERQLDREHPSGDHMAEVLRASRRAADLCRQILAYAGRGQVASTVVDLNEVVTEMGELLSVSFPKDAVVDIRPAPNLPPVWADVTQMRQVVMNLLTNAADSLPGGKGHIVVETGRIDARAISPRDLVAGEIPAAGTELVHFTVTDSGSGMDAEMRTRVFEPFFSTKAVGRGLGLAVVLGIVRSHGGCLELVTAPGEGARFRMVLPVTERKPPVTEGSLTWEEGAAAVRGKILLVDDEDGVRSVARRMLEQLELEVVEATDGMEAVEVFRRERQEIAAVVMDVTMPRMDGYQALMAIRQLDRTARILLTTGNVQDAQEVEEVWGVPLLAKPYRAQELHAAVMAMIIREPEAA